MTTIDIGLLLLGDGKIQGIHIGPVPDDVIARFA